jgi:hypothetical protein
MNKESGLFFNGQNLKKKKNINNKKIKINKKMTELFLEFIEIYINQVIYLRSVYPHQVFRRQKAYSTAVYCSIYPDLNQYIKKTLLAIQCLLQQNNLKKIEIIVYDDVDDIANTSNSSESFVIDVLDQFSIADDDKYLISLSENFRRSLLDLEIKCKELNRNSRRSLKFKIYLHTTKKSYNQLSNESKHQVFVPK